jgi:hypothetical protein
MGYETPLARITFSSNVRDIRLTFSNSPEKGNNPNSGKQPRKIIWTAETAAKNDLNSGNSREK